MADGENFPTAFGRSFERSLPYWMKAAQDRRRGEVYDALIGVRLEEARRDYEAKRAEAAKEERVYGERTATWHALPFETQEAFFVPGKIPRMTALGMAQTLKDVEPGIAARIEAAAGPFAMTGETAAPPGSYEQKVEEARLYNQAIAGDSQAFMGLPEDKQKAVKSYLDVKAKVLDTQRKQWDWEEAKREYEKEQET